MRKLAFVVVLLSSIAAFAADAPLPTEMMQAKTVFILKGPTYPEKHDPSGEASYVQPCRDELAKWGRFKIVSDPKDADVIIRISTRTQDSFLRINNQSRKSVDGWTILDIIQPSSGKVLWSDAQSWAHSWSTKTSTSSTVKHLRKRFEEQESAAKTN